MQITNRVLSAWVRRGLWIIILLPYATIAQEETSYQIEALELLPPQQAAGKNLIEIRISDKEFQSIIESKGEKIVLHEETMFFNGDKLAVKSAHLRGNTSLYLPRKSFSVSLHNKAGFLSKSLKDFYLISMSMDRNYFRNYMAFELMQKANLFGLFYTYTELKINDKTQGIYLLVQRPQDYALKDLNAPFVIRRGYDHQIDKYKAEKHLPKDSTKMYMKQFRTIYKLCRKYEGQALYDSLSELLDIRMYMRWMAFNYWVKNGDYTDEVYFYRKPHEKQFAIIPWDYDDIFRRYPHEGQGNVSAALEGKLIFSGEDELDLTIANDAVLYKAYLEEFDVLLNALSDLLIHDTFQGIYEALYPYFQDEAVIATSQYDAGGLTDIQHLQNDLKTTYTNLLFTKMECRKIIKAK